MGKLNQARQRTTRGQKDWIALIKKGIESGNDFGINDKFAVLHRVIDQGSIDVKGTEFHDGEKNNLIPHQKILKRK
jgi:hypothetical protein